MPLIRSDIAHSLHRLREMIAAAAVMAFGAWLTSRGGYVYVPLGLGLLALGAGLGVIALRHLRFSTGGEAPGVVEVVEGQISYLGPHVGGMVSLPDLVELRLLTLRGRKLWRLKQSDGQALLIPVEATGADRLYDAFASLPGMDTAALVAALHPAPSSTGGTGRSLTPVTESMITIWQRRAREILRT
jgi:hypothetical protein